MTLKIISPKEILFEGEVKIVTLPGAMGKFTVLKNHASIISSLVKGTVSFNQNEAAENENTRKVEITGGIAVVKNNIVSVCLS